MFCGCDAPEDRLPWSGLAAGEQECLALGWFAREVAGTRGRVACGAADPGAMLDLGRFATEYRWSRKQRKYVPRRVPIL